MDLSITPAAQFGTLATHGSALDGRRQGEDTPGGHRQQRVQRTQATQTTAKQLAGQMATVSQQAHAGQFRPVETGQKGPRTRNNGGQSQPSFSPPDVAQAEANARQQAAETATRAAATRFVLQTQGGQAAGGNVHIGYLNGSAQGGDKPSPQALSRASDTYSFMARQGIMTKALAPWGTGISMQV